MDSSAWDDRYSAREYLWTVEVNQFVEECLTDLVPGDAIDLAAGEGRNAVWLALNGWNVTAVDFSVAGLDKAKRLAADHDVELDLVEADATTFIPDEPVDLVLISYLQLGREHQQTVLENAQTWLKPGGTLFVIAHDENNVTDGWGGPSSPEVCYSLDRTRSAITRLALQRAEVVERRVETDDGSRVALDTLVMARCPDE